MWIIPALFVKDVQLSFPLLSPKGKVNIFVWRSFLEYHMLLSTCHFCWCCLALLQMCLSSLHCFSSGKRYVQDLWLCFHRSPVGTKAVSLSHSHDPTTQFQILRQHPTLWFEAEWWRYPVGAGAAQHLRRVFPNLREYTNLCLGHHLICV